jgi:iron complex transport system substrate-binding protein
MDMLVEGSVVVELKTVESLLRVHAAQLLSYLRLAGKPVGLLINFNSPTLRSGLKRIVNNFSETSASRRLGVEESLEDAPAIS